MYVPPIAVFLKCSPCSSVTCIHDRTWMVLYPRCGTILEGLQLAFFTWHYGTDMHALYAGHSSVRAACPRGARARPVFLSHGRSLGVSSVCHIPNHFPWFTSGNIFIKKSLRIEILELRVYACSVLTRMAGLWAGQHVPTAWRPW